MRWVWPCFFLLGCGGGDFASAVDAGAATPDVVELDVHGDELARDELAAADIVGELDAVAETTTCTPVTSYPAPASCECFLAPGNCPMLDGGYSLDCLWAQAPTMATGQPTCRGCARYTLRNDCHRCKETFNCACLAPSLQPDQRCCDSADGPYLSSYACP